MSKIFIIEILITTSTLSEGFSTIRRREENSRFNKILSSNVVQSTLHPDLPSLRTELVCRWEMFLASQVCWVGNSVQDLDSFLSCMEARFSDECHDDICAEMSDAGAPCPGDNRITTKRGLLDTYISHSKHKQHFISLQRLRKLWR